MYYGDFKALKGINLKIPENEITAFIGPSGCGKSTLLKSLNRMNDLVEGCRIEGKILLDGEDCYAKTMNVNELRKRVGMVFQKPNPFPMSVYDNIAYGPRTHGVRSKSQLDDMLEQLHKELICMGALCEEAISTSTKLLCQENGSIESIESVEEEINAMERKIENMCMKLLLRQQPVAKDLRQISSALKMISDMERIGDQALDIAEVSKFINKNKGQYQKLEEMANSTIKMVTEVIDSFVKGDLEQAKQVMDYDDIVDDLFVEIKQDVITKISKKYEDGEYLADVLMAAKYYERIGDHAVNIAEWVVYSITGKHVKESTN